MLQEWDDEGFLDGEVDLGGDVNLQWVGRVGWCEQPLVRSLCEQLWGVKAVEASRWFWLLTCMENLGVDINWE